MKRNKLLILACLTAGALGLGVSQVQGGIYGPVPTIDYNYPHYANSPILTKFKDKLPGLKIPAMGVNQANDLGQVIPVAQPVPWKDLQNTVHNDQDYYEIGLVEYREQMHSDLPPLAYPQGFNGNKTKATGGTRLRGYVQLSTAGVTHDAHMKLYYPDGTAIQINGQDVFAVDNPHYLGPLIIAQTNRPVRVRFFNLLPTEAAGNLFLPVDTTVAGAGPYTIDNPNGPGTVSGNFTQNRATLHLHGGLPGWESDGTVHQWITPAGDSWAANYPEGQSVEDVPDMGIAPAGAMDFYWPNQQSGRLLFYHDHAWGMTAANVYAGEAAGYLVIDPAGEENALAAMGVPGTLGSTTETTDLAHLVPLVIQDKTWVWGNNNNTVNWEPQGDGKVLVGENSTGTWAVDPMWAKHVPDSAPGDLWTPHIYVPIQDPYSPDGLNPYGRWHYGPWFWPIFPHTANLPENSHCPESFQDTPVVNGTAYPYLEVEPAKYRFRILNAAADRFWNLQWYVATEGIVSNIVVTSCGSGFEAPIVTITPNPGEPPTVKPWGATASAIVEDGVINQITVVSGGHDYQKPVVKFIDPTGTGATAEAIVSAGAITGLRFTSRGAGYSAPQIEITEPTAPLAGGAQITATVADGAISTILLDTVGSGYTLPPTVTIDDFLGSGGGATAIAEVYTQPTEVGMVPFTTPQTKWPKDWGEADTRLEGVPDPKKRGPAWVQIGHEGGLLPSPTVILNKPIDYDYNRGSATVLNVDLHTIYLGPAERADVVVDFSQFKGKTIILYSDCPAPTPAGAGYYDYFTACPDQREAGGAAPTLPGQGPNTRTIMQVKVGLTRQAPTMATVNELTPADTAPPNHHDTVLLTSLQNRTTGLPALYKNIMEPPIVMQPPYGPAFGDLNGNVPGTDINWYSRISNNVMSIYPYGQANPVLMELQPKAIAEEMDFKYARMNATLGVELPFTGAPIQTTIWYGLIDPPTEIFNDGEVQLWKLTHNGVDTHAIHFHIVNVQIVNRVGWDNWVKPPGPEELGWKDTIKMNPLEDIIFATRAKTPNLPFKVPHSKRHHNPEEPTGSTIGFMGIDPLTGNNITVLNQEADFGWEYVWHCHLLGHEEYDMMRPFIVNVAPPPPTGPTAIAMSKTSVRVNWVNPAAPPVGDPANSRVATSYVVERQTQSPLGSWTRVGVTADGGATTYTDNTAQALTTYKYRVRAENAKSFSDWVVSASVTTPAKDIPAAPSNLTLTLQSGPWIVVSFLDNANNETRFRVQRSMNGGAYSTVASLNASTGVGLTVTWTDKTITAGNSYAYRVQAYNADGSSAWTQVVVLNVPALPVAPSNVVGSAVRTSPTATTERLTVTWTDNANNETGFTVQWSSSSTFAWINGTATVAANTTTFTTGDIARQVLYCRVRADNLVGSSAWVVSASVPIGR